MSNGVEYRGVQGEWSDDSSLGRFSIWYTKLSALLMDVWILIWICWIPRWSDWSCYVSMNLYNSFPLRCQLYCFMCGAWHLNCPQLLDL